MKKYFVFGLTLAMLAICSSAFANSIHIRVRPNYGVAGSLIRRAIEAGGDEVRRHNITTVKHLNPNHINKYIRVKGDISRLQQNSYGMLAGHLVDYSCNDYLDFECAAGDTQIKNLVCRSYQKQGTIILGGYVRNINGLYVLKVDSVKIE